MSLQRSINTKFNYGQYLDWDDGKRWELIDGIPYDMSPAPNRKHQKIIGNLFIQISNYFKGKPCEIYIAPFDIRLSESYEDEHIIETVVQPDLSIFFDKSKLDEKGAKGAPDWVIEVLSPGTAYKDLNIKLLLYQQYQVKEYWIVDPETSNIHVFQLDNSLKYLPGTLYEKGQPIDVSIFKDLRIETSGIFTM